MIAALFVERGGAYSGLPHVDVWCKERDARLYNGPWPVVAHPPCQRWSILAPSCERRLGLRVGDDGGCFEAALAAVHKFGGVLEHPAYSFAWRTFGLGEPVLGGWNRLLNGAWTCQVYQRHYGHPALKPTWLYYVGELPPETLEFGKARVADTLLRKLRGYDRDRTPTAFRDKLISLALCARKSGPPTGGHLARGPREAGMAGGQHIDPT